MKIEQLQTNHLKNPLGYHFESLHFSWIVRQAQGHCNQSVRLVVSFNESFTEILYDSKEQRIEENWLDITLQLKARQRYFWKVQIKTDQNETCESEIAWFETGKMQEAWSAKWISTEQEDKVMPILYKQYKVMKKVQEVKMYVCGLGLYEVYINGKKVGNEFLMPGYHSYDSMLQYQTIDIGTYLQVGSNTIEVLLGDGWYKGRFGFDDDDHLYHDLYGKQRMCILECHLKYEDGTQELLCSDASWSGKQSQIGMNNIYDGENIDETIENHTIQVTECLGKTEFLTERYNPPIMKEKEFFPCKKVWNEEDQSYLLDFGEMITGWVEIDGIILNGQSIKLQYGEILQDGQFYRDNLRTAKAEFVVQGNGQNKTRRPHFTYYGFRYVKVTGMDKDQDLSFVAYRLMSNILRTGSISTSNELLNKLFENTMRSQMCNFLDIPTDCPQRDERMGWTGDVSAFAQTACFHMDCSAFFNHYMENIRLEQKKLNGAVPFFVPFPKIPLRENTNPFYLDAGATYWSDVATILPWNLYSYYGDKSMLESHFEIMEEWVGYIQERVKENPVPYLWQHDRQLGDWLALDNGNIHNPIGKTDQGFIASAYFYWSVNLVGKAAKILQKSNADAYLKLREKIKNSFLEFYFNQDGVLAIEPTQTACAIILEMGLYPAGKERLYADLLEKLIEENDGKLNTGFVGTPLLCNALSNHSKNRVAYDLLLNESYPGWLHEVKMGATSVWERWNSLNPDGSISDTGMNSLNHYAYGSISNWMYRVMCGFHPDFGQSKELVISPLPDERIAHVRGSWMSPYGEYVSEWKYEGEKLVFHFEIPFNAKARVCLSDGRKEQLYSGTYDYECEKTNAR